MVMFDMVRLWGNFPVITTVGGDITEDNVEEMYPTYFLHRTQQKKLTPK